MPILNEISCFTYTLSVLRSIVSNLVKILQMNDPSERSELNYVKLKRFPWWLLLN